MLENLPAQAPDKIIELIGLFKADTRTDKIDRLSPMWGLWVISSFAILCAISFWEMRWMRLAWFLPRRPVGPVPFVSFIR